MAGWKIPELNKWRFRARNIAYKWSMASSKPCLMKPEATKVAVTLEGQEFETQPLDIHMAMAEEMVPIWYPMCRGSLCKSGKRSNKASVQQYNYILYTSTKGHLGNSWT